MWKRLREFWYDERGGKGGGSAPQQRPPSEEELAQIRAITSIYEPMGEYYKQLLPWQQKAAEMQLGYETGMQQPGATAPTGGKQGMTAPQPGGTQAAPAQTGIAPTQTGGGMGGKLGGTAPQPAGTQAAPTQAGGGAYPGMGSGLIGQRAGLQSGLLAGAPLPGRYSALGTAYETSPAFESAMTGTAEWLQSRGLLKTGLMGELSSKRAAEIAMVTEGQRRGELQQQLAMTGGGRQ